MRCGLGCKSTSVARSNTASLPVLISRTIASASASTSTGNRARTGQARHLGGEEHRSVIVPSPSGAGWSRRTLRSGIPPKFEIRSTLLYNVTRPVHTYPLANSISDPSWLHPKSSRRYSTSSSTNDSPKKTKEEEEEEFPLPLPRSLAPSTGLFLLHLPIPPTSWPSHLNIYSNLLRQATLYFKKRGVAVNCIYDGHGVETEFREEEKYHAKLITLQGIVEWGRFDKDLLGSQEFRGQVEKLLSPKHVGEGKEGVISQDQEQDTEILICTHGSRDCRCSDRGGALVQALKDKIAKRNLGNVRIREIAHVGGHKYAANAIVLPQMDMYSNLLPSDAPAMLDHLTTSNSKTDKSQFSKHWRGRYGHTEEEQAKIWASINPDPEPVGEGPAESSTATSTVPLRFKTFEGEIRVVDAKIGDTLLQVARQWDLPSMEGSCGGNLECSTCHVYIPLSCPIPEPTDSELDMLGYALGFNEDESRLGCQVKVDEKVGEWCKSGGEFGLPRY